MLHFPLIMHWDVDGRADIDAELETGGTVDVVIELDKRTENPEDDGVEDAAARLGDDETENSIVEGELVFDEVTAEMRSRGVDKIDRLREELVITFR